jgi:hypothetical protein
LLFLSIIALILDIIIFTEGKIFYSIEDNKESFNENAGNTNTSPATPAMPSTTPLVSAGVVSSVSGKAISLIFNRYKDINDIILSKIKEYTDKNYNKKTSVNVYIR